MRRLVLIAGLAALLARPAIVAAQEPVMPRWDAAASFGLMFGDGWYRDDDSYDEPHAAYHLELGRYWTTHLKTDAAVILTPARHTYQYNEYPVGVPFGYTFTEHERRATAFSGAVTYQFFENAMMHPFVSGGVQIVAGNDHAFRNPQTYTISRVTYTIPALNTRTMDTVVRPYVSVGAKSYFNERTFLKSEWLVGVGHGGVSHSILRLGFGFDF